MPSDRKQINVRVDAETEALLPALCEAIGLATGLKVTNSDLFRMGMHELKRRYLPDEGPAKAAPARKKA